MGKKIRVLYDELGFRETHGGVSRYFTELIKHLPEDVEGRFSAVCSNNVYLQSPPFNVPQMPQDVHDFICGTLRGHSFPGVSHVYRILAKLLPSRFPSGELQNRRAFAAEVTKGDFDIFHLTDPHPYFNWWKPILGKKPIVATIHDLIPDLNNWDARIKRMRRRLVNDVAHLIAVSKNTKQDLIRLYGVDESKISVVYHGYVERKGCEELALENRPLTERYLLFVGKRDGYKNFRFFVQAIVPLLKEDCDLSVYCTGLPFNADEISFFDSLGVRDKIVQHFVPDEELYSLYAGAAAFVYPSQYEGFGIPILDAFSAGCPVLLSNASCFPEVACDAALYFEIEDVTECRDKLRLILNNVDVRTELINKGKLRVKDFSWEKCANETAAVYARVLEKQ